MATAGFSRRRPQARREGSLAELEALGRDAARGAGLPWGLAEEAGAALRWLEARRLPGTALTVAWLEARAERAAAELTPEMRRDGWTAPADRLCPYLTGAAIADRGDIELALDAVAYPLLLAPFVAAAARSRARGLELAWDGGLVCLAVDGEGWRAEGPALEAERAEAVSLHPASAAVQPGRPKPRRPELPVTLWDELAALARRGRAPEPSGDDGGDGAG
jgi:hypothetical protein